MSPDTPQASTDADLWRRARQLFLDVCTLPASEREAYLHAADAGGDVIAAVQRLLLRQDEATDASYVIAPGALAQALGRGFDSSGQEKTTASLGEFRIERTLGEGGMGRVYLAVRESGDVVQRVALKVVPSAAYQPQLIEQLRRERAILAGLEHPHIARLIDSGELPDGRPYFAMEYVDGKPLTQHCDDALLPLARRIQLFLDVVDAVAHAHRRFVLHRDIKAGNILVDGDGRVRLLDFGIAKSLDEGARDATLGGNFFSLRAAAPEQILGAATTIATDVYGLGCLLHELLTGRLPFELGTDQGESLLRRIVEQPPPLASEAVTAAADVNAAAQRSLAGVRAHAAALRGDLDLIIAKALRKRPAERYATADEFAADLRSVLDLRPIAARSSERWYRLRMLLRRHSLTAAVATVLGVAVIATTALSVVQSIRAGAERDRAVNALSAARLQRDHAERVTEFLVNAFRSPDPQRGEISEMRANEMLDRAAETLDKTSAELGPELHATIAHTLSHIFYLTDRPPQMRTQVDAARAQLEKLTEPPVELLAHQDLAEAQVAQRENRYPDAITLANRGLARIADPLSFEDHRLLHQLWFTRVFAASYIDHPSTVRAADEALAVLMNHPRRIDKMIDAIRQRRINAISGSGDYAGALALVIALRDEQRAGGRDRDGGHVETLRQVGQNYARLDKLDAATAAYHEALQLHETVYGVDNSRLAMMLPNVASIYARSGRRPEALYLFARAVTLSRRFLGDVDLATSNAYFSGAERLYDSLDAPDAAAEWVLRAVAALPPKSLSSLALMQRRAGDFLQVQGQLFESGYYYEQALPGLREFFKGSPVIDAGSTGQAYLRLLRYDLDGAAHTVSTASLERILALPDLDPRLRKRAETLRDFFGNTLAGPGTPVSPLRAGATLKTAED